MKRKRKREERKKGRRKEKEEKKGGGEKREEKRKDSLNQRPLAWKVTILTVDRPRLMIACTYYTDIYRES